MPKWVYEGTITIACEGTVEADSEEEAREIIRADMDWDECERWTDIDWLEKVED